MKRLIATISIILLPSAALAGEPIQEISWMTLKQRGLLPAGTEVVSDSVNAELANLKVTNTESQPVRVTVLTLEHPPITRSAWAIEGQVRYEGVEGTGYLEMWSFFPDGTRFFSRTLGTTSPTQSLQGTSGWRPFVLAFFSKADVPAPSRLEFNVVLPGKGTVWLGPLRLEEVASGGVAFGSAGQWWGERTGGLLGGLAGGCFGVLGALIGVLCSLGKARRFVLVSLCVLLVAGVAALSGGVVAVVFAQPYAVYYPLLLLGLLSSLLPAGLLYSVRKRYEACELRKMSAMDAR